MLPTMMFDTSDDDREFGARRNGMKKPARLSPDGPFTLFEETWIGRPSYSIRVKAEIGERRSVALIAKSYCITTAV